MKKLYSIFLLSIFFFSSNGYWIINQINYLEMKEKVEKMKREGIGESDIRQFTFSDDEFSKVIFHDNGEEMEVAGKMYDIVKIKKEHDKNIVSCLSDAKETELKLLAKKHQEQRNLRYKNTLSKIYIPSRALTPVSEEGVQKNTFNATLDCGQICSISYDILKPPPQAART